MGHFENWSRLPPAWNVPFQIIQWKKINKQTKKTACLALCLQPPARKQGLAMDTGYVFLLFLWFITKNYCKVYSQSIFQNWLFFFFFKKRETQCIYHLPLLFIWRGSSQSIISSSRAWLILPYRWRAPLQRCARKRKRKKNESKATFCAEYDVTRLPLNLLSFKVSALICSGFLFARRSSEVDFEVDDKKKKKKEQKKGRPPPVDGLELHCLKCVNARCEHQVQASSARFRSGRGGGADEEGEGHARQKLN